MIFYSESFTNKTGYNKQRKELCKQIKKYFGIDGHLYMAHNAIILQNKVGNKWINVSDSSYDAEVYATWKSLGEKRLITLDLVKNN